MPTKEEPDRWGEDRLNPERTEEKLSPSGRYRLVIRYYDQGKRHWRYSRGTAYRVSDGSEVADIKRNYSVFHHSFVTKNGHEYLISGRSYMGQTIVNLDTGVEFNDTQWIPKGGMRSYFCWADHKLSPDGNTLLVDGCIWAAPYEYRFFDFSDPESKGWPQLPIIGLNGELTHIFANHEGKEPELKEDTVVCYETTRAFKPTGQREEEISLEQMDEIGDEAYDDEENWEDLDDARIVLRRVSNEMRVVEWWKSEHKEEQERRAEEFQNEFNEKVAAFRKTDRCKRVYALAERHGVPTQHIAGWRAWKNWEVSFSLRRKNPKASADLTWETEGDASIQVRVYDQTGNNPEVLTFPNNDLGFEEALHRMEETFAC